MKTIGRAVIVLFTIAVVAAAQAASFNANNLVICRIGGDASGNPGATLTNVGNIVWLDEYTTDGVTRVQSVMLRTNYFGANSPLIASGTAFGSDLITRSVDGRFILVCGYGATLGQFTNFSLGSSYGTEAPRIIGLVDGNGNMDTTTALTNSLVNSEEVRAATSSDGTNLWLGGSSGGVRYTTRSASSFTQLSSFLTNIRQLNTFGDHLYFSTSTGLDIITNTPPPTTSGAFEQLLTGTTNVASPWAFLPVKLANGADPFDTLYVADATTNGVLKYSLVGSAWVNSGSFAAAGAVGLTGRIRIVGTTTNVDLWVTGGGGTATGEDNLYAVTDSSGYNVAVSGYANILATSPSKVRWLGIADAPVGGETTGAGQLSVGPVLGLFSSGSAAVKGCTDSDSMTYSLANPGNSSVNWSASADQSWVTISPPNSTLGAGGSISVSVSFNANRNSLTAGTYDSTVTFTNTTSGLGSTTRQVHLVVADQDISPSTDLGAKGASGGPFSPSNKVYTVYNGSTPITLVVSKTANWIDLSATSIALGGCAGTNVAVSLNSNANTLSDGFYSDVITFSNATAGTVIDTRNVSLAIGAVYFCDDFSAYNQNTDLVGQKGWTLNPSATTLPIQVTNGVVLVPSNQSGDNQDAYKAFAETYNTTVYLGVLITVNSVPPSSTTSPSYCLTMANYTNGWTSSGPSFANYRLSARAYDAANTNYVFCLRTTGQSGAPFTFGTTPLKFGTQYQMIVRTDPAGTNGWVYINPTSADPATQLAYLMCTGGTGIGPATNLGCVGISQFVSTSANVGFTISKLCVSTNYLDVYNGVLPVPADPFATWQSTYFAGSGGTLSPYAAPSADPYGKGISNTNQFLAGFNPTNTVAYPHITQVQNSGSNVAITYLGASGDNSYSGGPAFRTNMLEVCTTSPSYSNSFVSTGTSQILSNGNGSGAVSTMTAVGGATNSPSHYYRVRVLVP